MQAKDYPVSFPYGATTPPYGTVANPYHRGDDHYMPDGTPVVINGTQIGLSGHTGWVTGPHLHIGRFVNGKDTNPNGQGFNLPNPVTVTDFGYDATNGNYVGLRDGQGIRWVYLHLNSSNVVVGQVLQQGASSMNDTQAYNMGLAIGQALMFTEAEINSPDYYNLKARIAQIKADPYNAPTAIINDKLVGYPSPHFQDMLGKASTYDMATKAKYDQGFADGKAQGGGNVPAGTYLRINKADIVEV